MNNLGKKERLPSGSGKKILTGSIWDAPQALKLAGAIPIGDMKLLFIIG